MFLTTKQINKSLIYKFESESELIKSIKDLHELFTIKRDRIGTYINSRKLVSAYTSYYMMTNLEKLNFVLDMLDAKFRELIGGLDFIDIGTGPGTFIWSYLNYFKDSTSRCFGVDFSTLMLEQADNIRKDHFHDREIFFGSKLPVDINSCILFFGHSINEIGIMNSYSLVKKIDPQIIFILEIGTPKAFNDLYEFRKKIFTDNYVPIFPCLSYALECPLLDGDWCHQVLKLTHPGEVERISQLVSLDRRTMPLIANIYVKEELIHKCIDVMDESLKRGRVLRLLKVSKFSFEYQVCYIEEGINTVAVIEILKKNCSKQQQKILKRGSTGQIIYFKIIKELPDKKIRVLVQDEQ